MTKTPKTVATHPDNSELRSFIQNRIHNVSTAAVDDIMQALQTEIDRARLDELSQLSQIAHEHADYLLPRAAILDRIAHLKVNLGKGESV